MAASFGFELSSVEEPLSFSGDDVGVELRVSNFVLVQGKEAKVYVHVNGDRVGDRESVESVDSVESDGQKFCVCSLTEKHPNQNADLIFTSQDVQFEVRGGDDARVAISGFLAPAENATQEPTSSSTEEGEGESIDSQEERSEDSSLLSDDSGSGSDGDDAELVELTAASETVSATASATVSATASATASETVSASEESASEPEAKRHRHSLVKDSKEAKVSKESKQKMNMNDDDESSSPNESADSDSDSDADDVDDDDIPEELIEELQKVRSAMQAGSSETTLRNMLEEIGLKDSADDILEMLTQESDEEDEEDEDDEDDKGSDSSEGDGDGDEDGDEDGSGKEGDKEKEKEKSAESQPETKAKPETKVESDAADCVGADSDEDDEEDEDEEEEGDEKKIVESESESESGSEESASASASADAAASASAAKAYAASKRGQTGDNGGVKWEILKAGHTPSRTVSNGCLINVSYKGRFAANGKGFDNGTLSFRVGSGEVVKGFDLGVLGMALGEKRRFLVPSRLGYGAKRVGPIPPNSDLIFEITVVSIM